MNQESPRRSRRFLVGVAVAVVAVAVAVAGTVLAVMTRDEASQEDAWRADDSSPEGTVDSFVAAAGESPPNERFDGAHCRQVLDLFADDYFEFTDIHNCLPGGGEANQLWGELERRGPAAVDDDRATVEAETSDGALRVTFELVRQHGAWKLDGFDLAFDDGPGTDDVEAVLDRYLDAQAAGDCDAVLEMVSDRGLGTQGRAAALSMCESQNEEWRDVEPTRPTQVHGDMATVRIEDLTQPPGWEYVITFVREGDSWVADSMEAD